MNLRELECVLELAREGSMSRAARKLFISQPALSQCLRRIETQLGARLFTRGANGLAPTFAGERYVEMAKRVMKTYLNFEADLGEMDSLRIGRIRLGTTVHLGSLMLPLVLPKFKSRYPNIGISVTEATSERLERHIAESDIDVSMMHLPFKTIDADYEEILRDRYVMVFSADHRLNAHVYDKGDRFPYIDPRRAERETFVSAFPNQRVRQICERIFRLAGISPAITIQSTSVQTAVSLASVGVGVTIMPESYISLFNFPAEPVYCYLEDQYEAYWIFVVAHEKDNELPAPAREFVRILKESVAGRNA